MEDPIEDSIVKDKKSGGRGKETLFRVSYQNQISLVKIADNKAHLIISINSIIVTVIFTLNGLKKGLSESSVNLSDYHTWVPMLIILLTSLFSISFAIRAAMPYVRRPAKTTKHSGSNSKSSLLFFANISSKTMDNYMDEMRDLLKSRNAIHENMIIDIYNQARVLSRKYKLINIAYQIFMYGFISGIVVYILVQFI
jgi:hypothetical protein